MKHIRNSEKYFAPKLSVNMKTRKPTIVIGIAADLRLVPLPVDAGLPRDLRYMKNQKRMCTLSLIQLCARAQIVIKM